MRGKFGQVGVAPCTAIQEFLSGVAGYCSLQDTIMVFNGGQLHCHPPSECFIWHDWPLLTFRVLWTRPSPTEGRRSTERFSTEWTSICGLAEATWTIPAPSFPNPKNCQRVCNRRQEIDSQANPAVATVVYMLLKPTPTY